MAEGPLLRSHPERLESAEELATVYAAVVASALDAIIVADEEGIVLSINEAAIATFGYSREEAVGRPIAALIVPERLRSAHESGMARYRATREPHVLGRRVEMEACRKDGGIIPVELSITEVNLPGRRLFTAHLRDLSAARRASAEIERQREALHQSEKLAALGSLLAGVAHELNNPLSIVLGQAVMLHEEAASLAGTERLGERAAVIEAAAERCARVVRSFLAIARQRKAERRPFRLAATLDGAIDLQVYGLRSRGIALTRRYEDPLPDVLADPDHVQQILVNLIVNAVQAIEALDPPRRIEIAAHDGGDGTVRVYVADNGPGVPADLAPRIFDPFFTTKPHGVGTGIGLSISRGLAEAQGGRLTLCPSPLGGAAFELSLPVAGLAARAEPADTPDAGVRGSTDRRALVVDDEPDIAALIAEALTRAGFACEIAAGGQEAQALIGAHAGRFDAAICDLRMPGIDGQALYAWIEAHHPALAERVVFVTGDALGPSAGRFLAECGRPVLEKPFAPADVVRLAGALPPHR